jgi:putative transposase
MWTDDQRKTHKPRGGRYPSDVADEEWAIIEPMIPPARTGGRKRQTDVREVFNAIRYVDRTGCQWRQLPKDFPPHTTVYNYSSSGFTRYCVLDRIHQTLLERCRETCGRERDSTAAIIDTHRHAGGESDRKGGVSIDPIGYDAGKKIKGIKRNALVDTEGHLLSLENSGKYPGSRLRRWSDREGAANISTAEKDLR